METSDPTRYDNLTAIEQWAVLSNRAAADYPQPIDYGLTHDDLAYSGDWVAGLRYKNGRRWFGSRWREVTLLMSIPFLPIGFVLIASEHLLAGMIALGFSLLLLTLGDWMLRYNQKYASAGVLAYKEALRLHKLYLAAAREAEQAAHEAQQALLRQKRSYWERLNGYEFEIATAEVLKQHQFNPRVTGGSADGGVDIEVARDGQKGVVQCKAHVACVGPHTVRDLFGVIHHSEANFGIIVSRGGFTKGAIDFARNKPIFLVDTSDLIAMQEGQDVLAGGFLTT